MYVCIVTEQEDGPVRRDTCKQEGCIFEYKCMCVYIHISI